MTAITNAQINTIMVNQLTAAQHTDWQVETFDYDTIVSSIETLADDWTTLPERDVASDILLAGLIWDTAIKGHSYWREVHNSLLTPA